jgi:hypothetical protein
MTPANKKIDALRKELPRLTELHDQFVSSSGDNFFNEFYQRLFPSKVTQDFYRAYVERDFAFIPDSEWPRFMKKVGRTVEICDDIGGRHWEKLHDVFNEALGARILTTRYSCEHLSFVPEDGKSVPDWIGLGCWRRHYAEVKTINNSDVERKSWYGGDQPEHTVGLPVRMVRKLEDAYAKAQSQLGAMPDAATARKVVILVVNVDYHIAPFDGSVRDLIRRELERIEVPEYFIHCDVRGVG